MSEENLMGTDAIVIKRTFSVDREVLFRAWTEPAQLKQWFSPTLEIEVALADVDLCVGGLYRLGMRMPDDGTILYVGGVYEEISPFEKIVFTWAWEHSEYSAKSAMFVTILFNEIDGGTELVLKHERFRDEQSRARHTEGWTGCLGRLATMINQANNAN